MSDSIAIKISNLSKRYQLQNNIKQSDNTYSNELWALKNIDLEIKKGEHVGLIGPNGSGKSTLLKILAGVTKPTKGKAELNGKVASILDIGAGFHPELNGKENVFLNGQLLGFSKKEIRLKYDEIVSFSGIEKFIHEPVKNYSNGMYLRLAFSIIAIMDFDIYLLDEVMSVGDADFRIRTNSIFKKDKTILMISHNMAEVADLTQYHVQIEKGEIVKNGYSSSPIKNAEKILFESGEIKIKKTFKNHFLEFELITSLLNENAENKNWVIHLHNKQGQILMSCIGFEQMGEITQLDKNTFKQIYHIDSTAFKSDLYELTFYLFDKQAKLNIEIKNSFFFEISNEIASHEYVYGNVIYKNGY